MNLLIGLQFDSVYHEHYSYLSATSVSNLVARFGITLIDVEEISTHGGSNRYWLSKDASMKSQRVEEIKARELAEGLLNESNWTQFSEKVQMILKDFRQFILEAVSRGEKVAGYGAAAKASTLINASKIGSGEISFIVDESPEKSGRFMPQGCIPIVSKSALRQSSITHIVIFPWNLADEIARKIMDELQEQVQVWCAIPNLRRIA
jgi:hypothetical protein